MTHRWLRATLIGLGVGILVLFALHLWGRSLYLLVVTRDLVLGFYTPTDVVEKNLPAGRRIRLGGLVAAKSLKRGEGLTVQFAVTDTVKTIPVSYTGILPDLFREGQGAVVEGKLDASGRLLADTVLVKHDESYMPPDVANALKDRGIWHKWEAKK